MSLLTWYVVDHDGDRTTYAANLPTGCLIHATRTYRLNRQDHGYPTSSITFVPYLNVETTEKGELEWKRIPTPEVEVAISPRRLGS